MKTLTDRSGQQRVTGVMQSRSRSIDTWFEERRAESNSRGSDLRWCDVGVMDFDNGWAKAYLINLESEDGNSGLETSTHVTRISLEGCSLRYVPLILFEGLLKPRSTSGG